jgi:hypothetical protein
MKTGCWLFIGAQHAAASGGTLHYASPRLKKDGRGEIGPFTTQYLQILKNIQDVRKVDVLQLQDKLMKTQQEKDAAQQSETKLRVELDQLHSEKEKAEILIQEYRSRLGLE